MTILARSRETKVIRHFPAANTDSSFDVLEPPLLEGIISLLKKTFHGQITIVTQNFRIVQVERKENFNPEELGKGELTLDELSLNPAVVKKKIRESLTDLEFGQVILVVKKGRLAQIERLRKERYSNLQGLEGDGI
jgi:hypothetical protein